MLMSRRYWSSEPSSYDDFFVGVEAMRVVPGDDGWRWETVGASGNRANGGGRHRSPPRQVGRTQCTRSRSRVQRTCVSQARSSDESGEKLKYTTSGRPRSRESGTK